MFLELHNSSGRNFFLVSKIIEFQVKQSSILRRTKRLYSRFCQYRHNSHYCRYCKPQISLQETWALFYRAIYSHPSHTCTSWNLGELDHTSHSKSRRKTEKSARISRQIFSDYVIYRFCDKSYSIAYINFATWTETG